MLQKVLGFSHQGTERLALGQGRIRVKFFYGESDSRNGKWCTIGTSFAGTNTSKTHKFHSTKVARKSIHRFSFSLTSHHISSKIWSKQKSLGIINS